MNNRFVFIVPFYNCKDFILQCVESVLFQLYDNYIVIFCDDNSNDGTSDIIPDNIKFKKRISNKRLTALENIHNCLIKEELYEEDIIVILDGDDYLIDCNVLSALNSLYNDKNCLITYGQYIYTHNNNTYLGHCRPYTQQEFSNLRNLDWRASHLRTFKKKVYTELLNQDPDVKCHKDSNGDFYKMTYDISMFHPMMEIAGYDKVYYNSIPFYYYRIHNNNDHFVNSQLQKGIENEIRSKEKFKQIF